MYVNYANTKYNPPPTWASNPAVVAFVLGLATAAAFVVAKGHFDATRRSRGGQYSAIVTPAAIHGVYHASQPTEAHRVQVSV